MIVNGDAMRAQPIARAGVEHGAAAECHHAAALECFGHRVAFERAEVALAVVGEQLGDRPVIAHDEFVGVGERDFQCARDAAPDARLTGPHRTDQHDRPCAHASAASLPGAVCRPSGIAAR